MYCAGKTSACQKRKSASPVFNVLMFNPNSALSVAVTVFCTDRYLHTVWLLVATYKRTVTWIQEGVTDGKCIGVYSCVSLPQFVSSSSSFVEHRASMKSFQALRSPALPLTSFHDLVVLLISSSVVPRYVLFGLPLLLYPWGFQSNAVFSIAPASLRNMCPIQFHFLLFICFLLTSVGWFSTVLRL